MLKHIRGLCHQIFRARLEIFHWEINDFIHLNSIRNHFMETMFIEGDGITVQRYFVGLEVVMYIIFIIPLISL